tara:strand:- start:805 stop:1056 length:252 start_codon:yes stop_codon:yes gene_type:complete
MKSTDTKEVLEELISTIEKNSFDNKATIENVQLWAKSWRREAKELKSDSIHNAILCKCEMKPLPNGDIKLTLCQKCIDEDGVC